MRKILQLIITINLIVYCSNCYALPAFPGAEGFGSDNVHGSGRSNIPTSTTVYKVTNLNTSGVGSLRACVEASGARVCVFETSGVISDTVTYLIQNPYLWIAGQTAPPPGIAIRGARIEVKNTHDILIQHISIRIGDDAHTVGQKIDGMVIQSTGTNARSENVVIDHVSINWAIDENFSTYNKQTDGSLTQNITLSNSIIAQGLYNSVHPEGVHSMGALMGSATGPTSLLGNILAHNYDRNFRLNPGGTVEIIGNLIYNIGNTSTGATNPEDTSSSGFISYVDFIGNRYISGPDTYPGLYSLKSRVTYTVANSRFYVLSNIGPTRSNDSGDEWTIADVPVGNRSVTRRAASGAAIVDVDDVLPGIYSTAGATPAYRNSVDSKIINEIQTGTGMIVDCVAVTTCAKHAGGWPVYAVNTRSLTLPASPNSDDDSDGYTNLEEWIHGYTNQAELIPAPQATFYPLSSSKKIRGF